MVFLNENEFSIFFLRSSEPSTRGVLLGYTLICTTVGMLTIYIMNTMMAWRTVAMVCSAVPVISLIAVYFVSLKQNKTTTEKMTIFFHKNSFLLKFPPNFSFLDSRNATMVAVTEPYG